MKEEQIRNIANEVGFSQTVQNNWEMLAKFAELYIEHQYVQYGWVTPGTVFSFLRRPDLKKTPLHKEQTKLAKYPAFFKRSDLQKTFPNEDFK